MASTYSTNLAIELIGTGDQAGTWGNTTNTNLGTLIEQAISGYVTQAVATGTDTTITIPNGATGVARNMFIELTGTGGASTNLIVPANRKLYFIYNNSTGAVTVKVSGQTGVSVAQGAKVILASNGTDIIEATTYLAAVPASVSITTLTAVSANITTLTGTSANITNVSAASLTVTTGNAAFTGTGQRITGDMTNATVSSRLSFQTSTANSPTQVGLLPSGSGTYTEVSVNNNSDPANASVGYIAANGATDIRIVSTRRGTGAFLPLTFFTNAAEKAQITTTGNFLVGTTTDVPGVSGAISDVAGNVRAIPRSGAAKTGVYTLAITDVGEYIEIGTGGAIDIPNGVFSTGDAVSFFNNTTGARTISLSITTAYLAGTDADKASVSLATRGIATVLFISNSVCVLTGNLT